MWRDRGPQPLAAHADAERGVALNAVVRIREACDGGGVEDRRPVVGDATSCASSPRQPMAMDRWLGG